MNAVKLVLSLVLGIIVIVFALKIIGGIIGLVVPVAIVAGLGYVIYRLVGKKSIGSNRHEYLP